MRRWLIEKLGGYPNSSSAIDALCLTEAPDEEWRVKVIRALGGFISVEDALLGLKEIPLKERHKILTLAVKKMFNTIDAEDILRPAAGGQWMFEGRTLSKAQIELLTTEAAQFQQMSLWKVLQRDVLYQANRKMYLGAENIEHVITSKFWLYCFDTIRTRLNSIAKGSPLFNKK